MIQKSLKTVGIIHYLSFFVVSSNYSIFQTNLDPGDLNVSVETKPFISLYCLPAVKLRNLIELILLISAQDKMLKSLQPLNPCYDISAQLYFLLIIMECILSY